MKHSLRYLGFLTLVFIMGCDQIIELDLPKQDPVLVVNAIFNPDSAWRASVTASQSIQVADAPKPVTNATVHIYENGAVIDTLSFVSDDQYVSSSGRTPEIGHSYTLKASAPNYAETVGSDLLPIPVAPTGMAWRDSVTTDESREWLGEFSFSIDDPAGAQNYYALSIYKLDTLYDLNDTLIYVSAVYPIIQDPLLSYDYNSGATLFDDATFDGAHRVIKVQIYNYMHDSSPMFFGLSSVSSPYYQYLKTMSAYLETGFNPFAEPVRVYSNMTPGMGIFAGSSTIFGLVP